MRARVCIVVAVACVMAACGSPKPAGLQVTGYVADIVFGAEPLEEVATPPAARPPELTAEQAAVDTPLLPPPVAVQGPGLQKVLPPPAAPRAACPDAPAGAAASELAPLNVPGGKLPAAGRYRWKKSGTQTFSAAVGSPSVTLSGFELRSVRNVRAVNDTTSTFDTVQPDLALRGLVVTSWQVKTAGVRERAGTLSQAVVVGEPERGLAIKSIDALDFQGKPRSGMRPFRPTTGLLVLPLPVEAGETFSSVAVDPATQVSAVFQAQVLRRDRTDACGEYVEGWIVKGTLTFSDQGAPVEYTVLVAPQLGALPISERYVGQNSGVSFDITSSIGQLVPDPEGTT